MARRQAEKEKDLIDKILEAVEAYEHAGVPGTLFWGESAGVPVTV